MVGGMLEGLGEYFGLSLSVVHSVTRADDADHDEFLVVYHPAATASGRVPGQRRPAGDTEEAAVSPADARA
jgi:hypothetical protein